MAVIEVQGLHKSYGDVAALSDVSFTVPRGRVFALLGPNGAGKTTTVEILEGYRVPDRGSVSVLGMDPATAGPAYRDRIGIVLQQSGIERELTVLEALRRLCRIYSRPADPSELVELAGLGEKAHARIKTLSGGQRRRLDLAAALAGHPELVFLDEPTTGFDPAARRGAWALIRRLAGEGTTVVLTTHYLDEAQHLADDVAVVSRGRIVASGDPQSLGGRRHADARITFQLPDSRPLPELGAAVTRRDGEVVVETPDPTGVLHALTGWALVDGESLDGLEVTRPTLEDVYLDLVGERTGEEGR